MIRCLNNVYKDKSPTYYYNTLMDSQKRKKFIITMVIVTVCATMVNYGLYNILDTYLVKPSNVYGGVQMNIISIIIIIVVVTVIMLVLIPKDTTDELLANMEREDATPEQQLQDIVGSDDELNKKID
jgi:uncharacterized membrane protein